MVQTLQNRASDIEIMLAELITDIKQSNQQNEQWALNWIDNINKLSVEF